MRTHAIELPGKAGLIHVVDEGPATTAAVYLSHSILSSQRMWDEQARHLAERGWRVVRADIRGHGDSVAYTPAATMDDLVSDTIAVLDALALETVHYVGLSLGGMIGFGLGIQHASRFVSLCLCDARADAPDNVAQPWNERIAQAEQAGSCGPLALPTMQRWFGQAFMAGHPAIIAKLADIAAGTSVPGFVGAARAIQALDYLPRVSAIQTPALLIVGEQDGVLPETNRLLQDAMPNARLEIIPDAGHLPNINHPASFNALLDQHLNEWR